MTTLEYIGSKVTTTHQAKLAYVYVRQSSLVQMLRHGESTELQYHLVERAVQLGWPRDRVKTIDEDLGKSGASAVGRSGFQSLMAEIGLGRVGLVLSYDASRLARNNSDWKPFSRNTLKNGFNGDPPDPSGPSSARANIAGAGIRAGGEGNPH